ncbi:MAG: hypothetical protein ACKO0V_23320, partial [bacterium]
MGKSNLPERDLPIVKFGGSQYAVSFEGLVMKADRKPVTRLPIQIIFDLLMDFPFVISRRHLRELGVTGIIVSGIEVDILRLIEKSILNPAIQFLMSRKQNTFIPTEVKAGEGFTASVFP